ncbi:hypothetical protein [Mesoterricola sediminis]|uniref:Chromosome partition protein Smc n=1 Tax=Mesoterricola sediminis TaxID=2927980 RepID=A0AA48KDK6_9BACT|nr:hypothetical protein [Mesoterricola sediminis]BDU78424.1 hypothetical protein METESE_33820 [Mesoterricola sediminis]
MARLRLLLPSLLALAVPGFAQHLPDKFRDNRAGWEESLAKGASAPVRKATESLLLQEGPAVNPSDYNAMHALVAVMGLAARSCVMEGAWEDAVAHLKKAAQTAADNASGAEATLGSIRGQHQANLKAWRTELAKLEQRVQDLDAQPGLTSDQLKVRTQARAQMDEYRNAAAASERSLGEIASILAQLRKEQDVYAASLAEWQGFLAKEKADIARVGSNEAYVTEKLEQVKGDDAKPLAERLAYARRLVRLDPVSADGKRFLAGLTGGEEEKPAPKPAPARKAKKAKSKKARAAN